VKKYEICTIKKPVILNINQKYEDIITIYKRISKKIKFSTWIYISSNIRKCNFNLF
jgi:hypothetical protein